MPNIESLSFELILNDDDFNKKIESVKESAKGLNTDISAVLESINKIGRGGSSAPKKSLILESLRSEIKQTEAEIKSLEAKYTSLYRNAAKEDNGVFISSTKVDSKFRDLTNEAETLRKKLKELQEAYKKLGGDKALASSFKETKKAAGDTNIELLQMREYYKNLEKSSKASADAQKRMSSSTKDANTHLSKQSRIWRDISGLALTYFSVQGASRLLRNLVNITAEFEKQRVSLQAILKDADGANALFDRIKDLAVLSPFSFKELVTYTKQLSAYSIPMGELYDTTKMLADISAGLGVGMDRLVLAYGQIRSAAFLRGTEVRQLTEAGVPILNELANQIQELEGRAISVGEVFDRISRRQISFEMVEKVFKDMTSEGGKFYQMQEVLAETLSGKLSNLTDAYQIMFSEIGNKNKGAMVAAVDLARSLAENYEKIGKILLELVATYGLYKVALVGLNLVEFASKLRVVAAAHGNALTTVQSLTVATQRLAKETKIYQAISSALAKVNPYAALAVGALALGTAIYKIVTAETQYEKMQNIINDTVSEFNSKTESEISYLKTLIDQMGKLEEGTDAYNAVKKELMSTYGQYLTDVDRENLAIGNLAAVYDNLAVSIREAGKEKALTEGANKFVKSFNEQYGDAFDRLEKNFEKFGVESSSNIAKEFGKYLRGEIDKDDFSEEARKIFNDMIYKSQNNATRIGQIYNPANLRQQIQDATDLMAESRQDLADRLEVIYGVSKKNADDIVTGWRQSVRDAINGYDKDVQRLFTPADDADAVGYAEKLRKEYSSLKEEMAFAEKNDADLYATDMKRLEAIEAIDKALHGVILTEKKVSGVREDNSDIKNIQSQIKAYQKLRDIYNDLVSYMSQGDARQLMATFLPEYGEMIYKDFDNEIINLGESLRQMGKEGKDAADALGISWGEEQIKLLIEQVKKAEDAEERYRKVMEDWDDALGLTGQGASLKVSQIVANYRKTIKKIEDEKKEAREALYNWQDSRVDGNNYGKDFFEQNAAIDNRAYELESDALVKAKDDARKAVEDIFNEWKEDQKIFGNLNEKSIQQLDNMKSALQGFTVEYLKQIGVYDNLKEFLSEEEIQSLLDSQTDAESDVIDEEKTKDKIDMYARIAKAVSKLSKAFQELAKETGNAKIAQGAEQLAKVADTANSMLESLKSGNLMGALIAGVTSWVDNLIDAVTETERIKNNLDEISRQQFMQSIDDQIKNASTLFGDSWMAQINAINSGIRKMQNELKKITSTTANRDIFGISKFAELGVFLETYAKELGMTLRNEDGTFVESTLDAIGEKYKKKLTDIGYMDYFEELKEDNSKLIELFNQLEAAVSSMFNSLGESITDEIINNLWAVGDAAVDLESIFRDLGNNIFRSLVQSFVIDEILSKYKDEVMSWWSTDMGEEDIASKIGQFAENVSGDLEKANEKVIAMFDAFKEYGIITNEGASNENTLANGIKGITEDTASLLASYVNAIRADVAMIRAQGQQTIELLPQAPTLAEYLTQIQANTYNTAENTRELMTDIKSMMTTSDGPALRVFM